MRLVLGSRCNLSFSGIKTEALNGVVLLYFRSFRCSWMTQDTWMKIWRSSWQSLTGGTIFSSQSWMSWGLCWTRLKGQGSWQSTNCWKPLNVWTCFTLRLVFSAPSPSLVTLSLLCGSLTLFVHGHHKSDTPWHPSRGAEELSHSGDMPPDSKLAGTDDSSNYLNSFQKKHRWKIKWLNLISFIVPCCKTSFLF